MTYIIRVEAGFFFLIVFDSTGDFLVFVAFFYIGRTATGYSSSVSTTETGSAIAFKMIVGTMG